MHDSLDAHRPAAAADEHDAAELRAPTDRAQAPGRRWRTARWSRCRATSSATPSTSPRACSTMPATTRPWPPPSVVDGLGRLGALALPQPRPDAAARPGRAGARAPAGGGAALRRHRGDGVRRHGADADRAGGHPPGLARPEPHLRRHQPAGDPRPQPAGHLHHRRQPGVALACADRLARRHLPAHRPRATTAPTSASTTTPRSSACGAAPAPCTAPASSAWARRRASRSSPCVRFEVMKFADTQRQAPFEFGLKSLRPMSFAPEPAFAHGTAAKTAVLLCNLGTPDAPTPTAVRRYLAEFLARPARGRDPARCSGADPARHHPAHAAGEVGAQVREHLDEAKARRSRSGPRSRRCCSPATSASAAIRCSSATRCATASLRSPARSTRCRRPAPSGCWCCRSIRSTPRPRRRASATRRGLDAARAATCPSCASSSTTTTTRATSAPSPRASATTG